MICRVACYDERDFSFRLRPGDYAEWPVFRRMDCDFFLFAAYHDTSSRMCTGDDGDQPFGPMICSRPRFPEGYSCWRGKICYL